jgi:hypothetical protein
MKRLVTISAAALGGMLFAYWIRTLGLSQIHDALVRIGWGFAGILLLGGAREAVRALAWTQTVEGPARLPFRDAFAARLAGEAINTLVPMGVIVGEPTKADHVRHRLPFRAAFRALMIEFAFYMASLPPLFALAAFALMPASAALVVPAAALVAVGRSRGKAAIRWADIPKRLRSLIEPLFAFAAQRRRRIWSIAACEIGYHALGIAEVYLTLKLLAPGHASVMSATVLETVNRGVTIIFKMLPMRVGVDEAGAALVATRLDLTSATAVTVALVRKLRLLAWSGVGVLILLARSARASKSVPVVSPVRG